MKQLFIILIIVWCANVMAQENQSVHQWHKQQFGSHPLELSDDQHAEPIIPLDIAKVKILSKKIFGYLPDWEYSSANIRYDIMSHIAAFDFPVSKTGVITNPSGWPWSNIINKAHLNGVKVIMCVVNFNGGQIDSIMKIESVKQTFFTQVKTKLGQYSLDGVNIDFEGINSASRGTILSRFLKELSDTVKRTYPAAEISFAAPSIASSYDVPGFVSACDYVFIMGYDFYGSWSTTTGPSAPLLGGSYNITNTVTTQYSSVLSSMPHKLILGVPYYGNKWKAVSDAPHAKVITYISSTRFKDDQVNSATYGRQWASDNQTPWYRFKADTGYYQIWYDNDSSLGLKYTLAKSKNLGGVGMWALGYDGNRSELWSELLYHFQGDGVDDKFASVGNYLLARNYPNPFNPGTQIRYVIPTAGFVKLTVFDVLGNEISTLVDEYKPAGNYHCTFSAGALSAGVYYYRLAHGNKTITGKMVLLK